MSSNVLFTSAYFKKYSPGATLPAKFDRMMDHMGLEDKVKDRRVAVKMHFGRGLGFTTIHPLFVKKLVDKLKAWGAEVFLTDHIIKDARSRGYTEEFLGCPIVEVAGLFDRYYYEKPVDYKSLKYVDVAGHIHDADFLVDLSHVKGHGACGYGGACKNISMGCVTERTRQAIHMLEGGIGWNEALCDHCEACVKSCDRGANSFNEGKYEVFYHHCSFCQHCVKVCPTGALTIEDDRYDYFQKGMALATKVVLDALGPGNTYYINFLTNITAVCDCWGLSTPSIVPDIGIMSSWDIVALERACVDAIKVENVLPNGLPEGTKLSGEGHLLEQLHYKDPYVQIAELEKLGLGSQQYAIEEVK